MKKTAKGALAAAAAAAVLMGGAGSLAYWNDTETAGGTSVTAGEFGLVTDATNAGCGDWTLDGGNTYTAGTTLLVPGDTLTQDCSFTIVAKGDHLSATVQASTPTLTGTLASALSLTVSNVMINNAAATTFDESNNGQTLSLEVTIGFQTSADNTSQTLEAALSDVTITATQVHQA